MLAERSDAAKGTPPATAARHSLVRGLRRGTHQADRNRSRPERDGRGDERRLHPA